MIAALVSLALLAPAPAGAGGAPPVVSLSATPSRVLVDARGTTRVEVANRGRNAIRVTAAADGLVLDLRGRPTLRRGTAARWLHGELEARYGVKRIGECSGVVERFYAIGTERKVAHPLVQRLLAANRSAASRAR